MGRLEREAGVVQDPRRPRNAHRTFLELVIADGATETQSKPAPAKKISNAEKEKKMSETEGTAGTSLGKGS